MPRPIRSGRSRVDEGQREGNWIRRQDEELEDLATSERLGEGGRRLQAEENAQDYGTNLEGIQATGVVLEVYKGYFNVELMDKPQMPEGGGALPDVIRVRNRGAMQNFDLGISSMVAAGDAVEIMIPPMSGDEVYEAVLSRVQPKRSSFQRLHPSGRAIQILAANVDQVVIVASTSEPPFRPGFVDRVLACSASCGLPAILIVNKIDLGLPPTDLELIDIYRGLGVKVLLSSAIKQDGLDAIQQILKGKRSVLCGHSGVGKSSLLRTQIPDLAQSIKVGRISTYTGKGRHTTTHARLFRLPEMELIDTPGVREFTPADTNKKNLWAWFPEIAACQGRCAYPSCTHTTEKTCAVLKAVKDGEMHPRRHESYVRIYETLPY